MAYFYLILQSVIFSTGGILIKTTSVMFSPFMTSFLRFAIGIVLLMGVQLARTGRIHFTLGSRLLIIGGIAKAAHYLGENYGVMKGFSYGGIIVWPVQTLTVLLISVFILKEKIGLRAILGAVLCILGIGCITWNGAPLGELINGQSALLLAFTIAGIGAAGFSLAQKKMVNRMEMAELNNSMFIFGMLVTAVSVPMTGAPVKTFSLPAMICMLTLGVITCVGFLLQGAALKSVPVFAATVIQSSTVILTLVWSALIFHEPITKYIICGTIVFIAGIILVNVKGRKRQ